MSKLCAFREKDRNFVAALLDADLVDIGVITARLAAVPTSELPRTERPLSWLAGRKRGDPASQRAGRFAVLERSIDQIIDRSPRLSAAARVRSGPASTARVA